MVDYSKWSKLEVSGSEEETPGAICAPRKHVLSSSRSGSSSSSSSSSSNSSSNSGGVDYSKWQHIGDDEEEESFHAPRVRRLSKDQSVTIGPDGPQVHPTAAAADAVRQQQQLQRWMDEERHQEMKQTGMSFEDAYEWPRCGSVQVAELPEAAAAAADAAAAAAGTPAVLATGIGPTEMQRLVRNGGVSKGRYFWKQTATEVSIFVVLPFGVRGRDLRIHLTETTLRISCTGKALLPSSSSNSRSSNEIVLLEGSFPHPVEADEDSWLWEVSERRIDWQQLQQLASHQHQQQQEQQQEQQEQTRDSSSSSSGGVLQVRTLPLAFFFVDIHLRKKKILPATDVWWPCILKGECGIDVSQLADRRARERSQSFRAAWEAAHAAFKERIKQHEKPQFVALDAAAGDGNSNSSS